MTGNDILTDTTFSRRRFVQGSSGLVVGFSLAGAATAGGASAADGAPVRGGAAGPPDQAQIDTWLQVNPDNTVTIYHGRVELGQGSSTGLLQIAAEELDVDFAQIVATRVDTNISPNQGSTVGSTSIRSAGPTLRAAAAEARQALLNLASANLGVPVSQLSVAKGVVSGGGKSVTYGTLVGGKLISARMTGTAPQKKVSDYKVVGQRIPRIDIPDKVSGKFTYIHNVRVPGMLHGRVVRPKGQSAYGNGAKVLSVDVKSIARIPGAQVVRKGDFIGVVAPHEYGAIQAAAQLKVTWAANPKLPGNGDVFGKMRSETTTDAVPVNTGNFDAAWARSDVKKVQSTYTFDYQNHGALGPMCAVADVKPGSATVLTMSQGVYGLRQKLAPALGMPETAIRVQFYDGSGCYGPSTYDDVAISAAIMSKAVGKPVRLQFMRWDEHGWDTHGPAQLTDVRGAVDSTGKIVAYEYGVWAIPYYNLDTARELAGEAIPTPGRGNADTASAGAQYALDSRKVVAHSLPLLNGYLKVTFLRAPLAPQGTMASEGLIDELAFAAGMDPVEFRRRNITDERWLGALNAAAAAAKWQPRVSNSRKPTGNVVSGRGVAIGGFASSFVGIVAEIEVNKKTGKIVVKHVYGAQDAGLAVNPALIENQMEGAMMQGVSRSLLESVKMSKERITSLDWVSYPSLRFKDAPNITAVVVNRPDKASSGSGEPALAPVAAAISHAFFDATGVRIRQAPMTPGRVRAALKQAGVS
jgi:CO/xanthine dehydrogenase Mo-binding subunit